MANIGNVTNNTTLFPNSHEDSDRVANPQTIHRGNNITLCCNQIRSIDTREQQPLDKAKEKLHKWAIDAENEFKKNQNKYSKDKIYYKKKRDEALLTIQTISLKHKNEPEVTIGNLHEKYPEDAITLIKHQAKLLKYDKILTKRNEVIIRDILTKIMAIAPILNAAGNKYAKWLASTIVHAISAGGGVMSLIGTIISLVLGEPWPNTANHLAHLLMQISNLMDSAATDQYGPHGKYPDSEQMEYLHKFSSAIYFTGLTLFTIYLISGKTGKFARRKLIQTIKKIQNHFRSPNQINNDINFPVNTKELLQEVSTKIITMGPVIDGGTGKFGHSLSPRISAFISGIIAVMVGNASLLSYYLKEPWPTTVNHIAHILIQFANVMTFSDADRYGPNSDTLKQLRTIYDDLYYGALGLFALYVVAGPAGRATYEEIKNKLGPIAKAMGKGITFVGNTINISPNAAIRLGKAFDAIFSQKNNIPDNPNGNAREISSGA